MKDKLCRGPLAVLARLTARRGGLAVLCYLLALAAWLALGAWNFAADALARADGALAEESIPVSEFQLVDVTPEADGWYATAGGDPQIILDNVDGRVVRTLSYTAEFDGEPREMCLYYTTAAGEPYSQDNRVFQLLEDGQIAWGDCAAVQYSGAGGRDPLFLAEDFIPVIDKYIKPALVGKEADNFRELTKMMEAIEVDGKRLHTAIRYGVSQAILDAVAKATKRLMSEVVADEYGTTVSDKPIPIFTQSGDNRYENADKMILKGAAILPHALINNVETKLGRDGSKLKEYVCWLRDRILKLRTDESYNPIFHIDVYGTIGQAAVSTLSW